MLSTLISTTSTTTTTSTSVTSTITGITINFAATALIAIISLIGLLIIKESLNICKIKKKNEINKSITIPLITLLVIFVLNIIFKFSLVLN